MSYLGYLDIPCWLLDIETGCMYQVTEYYENRAFHLRLKVSSEYLASEQVMSWLSARLQEEDGPQIVLVTQQEVPELAGKMTMGLKSAQMLHQLLGIDHYRRLSVVVPCTSMGEEKPVNIHSKIETSPRTIIRGALLSLLAVLLSLLALAGILILIHGYDGEGGRQAVQALLAWLDQFPPYTLRSLFWGMTTMTMATLLMIPTAVPIIGFVALWGEWFGGFTALTSMLVAAHLFYFTGRLGFVCSTGFSLSAGNLERTARRLDLYRALQPRIYPK